MRPSHCFWEACLKFCGCVCAWIYWYTVCTACIVNIIQRFLCQQMKHRSFSGSSYHIDMLKCELSTQHPAKAIADESLLCHGTALAFFVLAVGSVAMVLLWYNISTVPPKILCGCCLLENSMVCVWVCVNMYVCERQKERQRVSEWLWHGPSAVWVKASNFTAEIKVIYVWLFLTKWQKTELLFLKKRIKNNSRKKTLSSVCGNINKLYHYRKQ